MNQIVNRMNSARGLLVASLAVAVAAIAWPAPTQAQSASASNGGTPSAVQIAQGAKAWSDNCGRCHNYRDPKEFSDKNWDVIVNHMRTIAPLPGQVAREIKAFLKASN